MQRITERESVNMRELWTNVTWANWLQSKGVPEDYCALVEVNGNELPVKLIAQARLRDDDQLFAQVPLFKRWSIVSWHRHASDGSYYIGSLHGSGNFMNELKQRRKLARKKKR